MISFDELKEKNFQFKSRLIRKSIRWRSLSCLHSAQWLLLFEIVQKSYLFFTYNPWSFCMSKMVSDKSNILGTKKPFRTWVQKQNCMSLFEPLQKFKVQSKSFWTYRNNTWAFSIVKFWHGFLNHIITFFFRKVRSWFLRTGLENFGCLVLRDLSLPSPLALRLLKYKVSPILMPDG